MIVKPDISHSIAEDRYFTLDKTDRERLFFVVFTLRKDKIRIISVRDMIQKERKQYNAKAKRIPKFKNENEEFECWVTHDSTEYIDYSKIEKVIFTNLRPTLKTISIRLPESLIAHLKLLANKRDVPYQSLMKMFLIEREFLTSHNF